MSGGSESEATVNAAALDGTHCIDWTIGHGRVVPAWGDRIENITVANLGSKVLAPGQTAMGDELFPFGNAGCRRFVPDVTDGRASLAFGSVREFGGDTVVTWERCRHLTGGPRAAGGSGSAWHGCRTAQAGLVFGERRVQDAANAAGVVA